MVTAGDAFNEALSYELRVEREARRLTVAELAQRSGLVVGTVHRYLKPERAIPIPALYDLCVGLHVDPRQIVHRAEARFRTMFREDAAEDASVSPAEFGRRLDSLVRVLTHGHESQERATGSFMKFSPALVERNVRISESEWEDLCSGKSTAPLSETAILDLSDVLGIDPRYLSGTPGDETVQRIDAQLEFIHALQQSRVDGFAASQGAHMTPDMLRAFTTGQEREA